MSATVQTAIISGLVSLAVVFGGQWLARRWRGPTDREQWDEERTGWMKALSERLEVAERKLVDAEDRLQKCEIEKLDQARLVDQLQARVADLERRTGKAAEVLAPHRDPEVK